MIVQGGTIRNGTVTSAMLPGSSSTVGGTSNAGLSIPANAAFNFGTGLFTIEGWVYLSSIVASQPIFCMDNGSAYLMVDTIGTGGQLALYWNDTATTGDPFNRVFTTNGAIQTNVWTHFCTMRNGDTYTLFLNGVCRASASGVSAAQMGSDVINWTVGNYTSGGAPLPGYVSNFRIVKGSLVYSYGTTVGTSYFTPPTAPLTNIANTSVLLNTYQGTEYFTADSSSNNFTITNNGATSSNFEPFTPTPYTSGLNLYLDASQYGSYPQSGNVWYDISGANNNATLTASPTYLYPGLIFDGTSQYATIASGNTNYIPANTPITISSWIKPNVVTDGQAIISKGDYFSDRVYSLELTSGPRLTYSYNVNNTVSSPTFTQANNYWFNAVATVSQAGLVTFYVNGNSIGTANAAVNTVTTQTNPITAAAADSGGSIKFKGTMGTALIYNNRELPASEILNNYNYAANNTFINIVSANLQVNLDATDSASYSGSGTTWNNIAPNTVGSYNATLAGNTAPAFTSGTGGYFYFNRPSVSNVISKATYSWPTNNPYYSMEIIVQPQYVAASYQFVIQPSTSYAGVQGVTFNYYNNGLNMQSTTAPVVGTWYVLCITQGAAGTVWYVNGQAQYSFGPVTAANTSGTWTLGTSGTTAITQIYVSRFKYYDAALTATQVLQNYTAQKYNYGLT